MKHIQLNTKEQLAHDKFLLECAGDYDKVKELVREMLEDKPMKPETVTNLIMISAISEETLKELVTNPTISDEQRAVIKDLMMPAAVASGALISNCIQNAAQFAGIIAGTDGSPEPGPVAADKLRQIVLHNFKSSTFRKIAIPMDGDEAIKVVTRLSNDPMWDSISHELKLEDYEKNGVTFTAVCACGGLSVEKPEDAERKCAAK